MSVWDTYPSDYRNDEVQHILSAVRAGECVAIVGLSGAGKSNLMGFLANRPDAFPHPNALIDCNRLRETSVEAFFRLIRRALGNSENASDEWEALDQMIARRLEENGGSLALLLDRFGVFANDPSISSNLRALRDAHKYQLTMITATRRPVDSNTELAELFFAHTLWLGPLSESDTRWNIARYAQRVGQDWDETVAKKMLEISWGYPSLLKAVCEAYAGGANLDLSELRDHAAFRQRLEEFWTDAPSETEVRNSLLEGLPLLKREPSTQGFDSSQLTAKEALLLEYLQSHPEDVCSKDDLVRAVWPEDQIYEQGIRDDSLAQLVRRLRVKIEPDPSNPTYIHTVPGRGYQYTP
jgi:energy-coupling factor transporter ATP-binding protein EcfA2